jgi:hypothetical protein
MAVSVQVIGERSIAIAPSATQIAVKDCVRPIAPKLDMIVPSLTGIPQHRSGRIFPHRLLLLLILSFPPFLYILLPHFFLFPCCSPSLFLFLPFP